MTKRNGIPFALFLVILCGAACAKFEPLPAGMLPPAPQSDGVVVKSQAVLVVQAEGSASPAAAALRADPRAQSGSVPVHVANSASSSMSLDSSQFNIPKISNQALDFGKLALSGLFDNDLNVCGPNGKTHCGTALIRMYTTGESGAGLYNATDQFGAPISAGSGTMLLTVGLGASGAALLQTLRIPARQHVLRLSDFSPAPDYSIRADFTDAGAGSYETTLVVEYALAP